MPKKKNLTKRSPRRSVKRKRTLLQRWHRFEYKHTALLVIIISVFVLLLDSALMSAFFSFVEHLGHLGMVIAGALFVSVFTTAASIVMLYELGQLYNPWVVIMFAAVGSTIGDFLILNLLENKIAKELTLLMKKARLHKLLKMMRRKKLRPLFLLVGLAIIGSPIPDEVGLTLLDLSSYSRPKILALCFVANALGIATIVGVGFATRLG